MYQVFLDDQVLYMPGDENALLIDPVLEMADSKSGFFTAKIPITNLLYDSVKELASEVCVKRDGTAIFYGRVLSVERDFYGTKTITCEGELAYLLDSVQEPAEYHDISVRAFLETLITKHNNQMTGGKKCFKVGQVTVEDPNDSIYRYTNWETTLDAITDKLVDRLGGHLRIRHVGTTRYLDYIEDFDNTNTQVIEFGENLLDYTENLNAEDIATRVIPLGKRLDDSPIETLDAYTTIGSVNNRKNYVESAAAIKTYGVITKTVHFEDVTIPANLKKKGEEYLKDTQFADVTLTLTAVDLHLLHADIEAMKVGDSIRVISPPHGMDRFYPLTELKISLDHPESSTVTLGTKVKAGLSERSVSENKALVQKIERLPTQSETLRLAKDNSTALITAATTGHVVTRKNEILVMDTADKATAKKVWRWNLNGLGYSKTGYNGTYGTAITMNGAIVADFITTGTLNADLIRAGTLKDKQGNISWNMSSGALTAKKLSIDSPNFKLTTYGYMTAKGASIDGSITASSGDTKVRVGYGHLSIYYNDKEVGLIGGNSFAQSNSIAGLNFDLENTGDYMTWAAQPASGGNYNMVWTYARSSFSGFTGGALNAGCDIDMHNYTLKNVNFEGGGISGTANFVKINSMSSDGTAANWSNNCYMTFKNGILIDGRF
ncbi:MAG: phage tail protein [Atopobium minutum]|uniref:Phage minor structural protein n=1 Tax=Atopobium minutum 10063974 TaxID=997872 RepID=N2BTX1_9ACTN|nr:MULTISPECIES: phage tail protein [Atopobium]EMZ41930.1 phage minor structural protein [Atopobium minutum 10063974]ERL14072.1 phage minor structural protein, N-terminal domain protein [Atopobium sp. BV3Ac4]MDU4970212.1 phage tail protein [Atopobium minutum]MDU5357182.1 phage tail protein [Atopobium minutum]